MAGFFSRIFSKSDPAIADATRIYNHLMLQSRQPEFYAADRVPDNYDGRIDLLTLHIAPVMHRLQSLGEQGGYLSQALYDVMRDDFEVALREEGLSDTGVKKRIKPIMNLFFTQVKAYVQALEKRESLTTKFLPSLVAEPESDFSKALSDYALKFADTLSHKALGEIAHTDYEFPLKP